MASWMALYGERRTTRCGRQVADSTGSGVSLRCGMLTHPRGLGTRIGCWLVLVLIGAMLGPAAVVVRAEFPKSRVITHGTGHHWFGYYDKFQFDPTNRYVLAMSVDFEHRSPTADDEIRIGMVDLQDGDKWIELGTSRAWNWQQGCMLQWLPGSDSQILWNDRQDGRFVCHLLDVFTRERRTIPFPIYSVSPDGTWAVSTDFSRIQDVRPGYGYAGIPDPHAEELSPTDSGILRVDLQTGSARQILSIDQIARMGEIPKPQSGIKHYFNHLLVSPDGGRFIALHRWRYPDGTRLTRLITADPEGEDIRIVIPNGYASHFIWRDPEHILVQSRHLLGEEAWANFLVEDKPDGGSLRLIGKGVLDPGGHPSYLPGGEWILSDTYPQTPARVQIPHLFHLATGRRVDLGHFPVGEKYRGEWRVDTHPRYSRDGRFVCIDAPDGERGRQLHLIDLDGWLQGETGTVSFHD